jgi:hypothetical protein
MWSAADRVLILDEAASPAATGIALASWADQMRRATVPAPRRPA